MRVKTRSRSTRRMTSACRGEINDQRGPVRHQQMVKHLDPMADVLRKPDWCNELQQRWEHQIPISDKMGIKINQYWLPV